jgi:acyl carrier protein
MGDIEIDNRLTDIFRMVFEDEDLQLTASTMAADVDGWDSVAHISLIFAVEEEFGFQFSSSELDTIQNVGDMQALIAQRTG